LANEVNRITDHAVQTIEAKGFAFTRTMMDNSNQIARQINEASDAATGAVSRSLQDLQTSHIAATETTTEAVTRKLKELQESSQAAVEHTTEAVTRKVRELQESSQAAVEHTTEAVTRKVRELHETTQVSVEQTKHTASSAVSEILETQNMLRADTTALFERLREANILLQEVLSGAHENMSGIEATVGARG